jgi:hypothetical protein
MLCGFVRSGILQSECAIKREGEFVAAVHDASECAI